MAGDRATTRRWVLAGIAAAGALLAFVASFIPWIETITVDGGSTAINGWGSITGSSSIAGTNLNEVLDGDGTYRPGMLGVIFAVIVLVAAIALASVSKGERPHRITASVLTLCGLVLGGWGLYRGIDAGDAGVFEPGEATAGLGPVLTAFGGALVLAAAVGVFAGLIDPPARVTGRRGIQPKAS